MEILAGKIISFYRNLGVASVKLCGSLEVGNLIHVKGNTTDFDQTVRSLQITHRQVDRAGAGDLAGLKVDDYVRKNDCIYRIEEQDNSQVQGQGQEVRGKKQGTADV